MIPLPLSPLPKYSPPQNHSKRVRSEQAETDLPDLVSNPPKPRIMSKVTQQLLPQRLSIPRHPGLLCYPSC